MHFIRSFRRGVSGLLLVAALVACSRISLAAESPPPQGVQRSGESEVQFNEGLIDYQLGRMSSAEQHFGAVLTQAPDDFEARYYMGLSLMGEEKESVALAEFDRVLAEQPAFGAARSSRAAALIRLKRFAEAEAELKTLESNPEFRPNALSLRGTMLYAQGRYPEAADMFAKAHDAGAEQAPEAALLRSLSLQRAGDKAGSREAMRQAAGIDLDPSLSVAARQLQEQDLHRRLQFDISAGYEYDSNVGLFQEGIATPRDIPHRDDGRFVIEPRARFSIIQNDKVDAGVSTTNYFSYQSTLSDFDVSSYQVGAFFNYQLTTNLLAGVRYDFNYVDLGHEPYLTRNFVTPEVTYFENNFGYTGAFYQYDAQQYTDIAGTGRLDRDGKIGGVGLVQSINLPEFFSGAGRAELQLIGRFRHQNTKGQDYDGDLYDTGAMLYLPLPMKLKADIGVNFDVEDYSNANSLDAENRQRHDSEFTFSAGLMRQLNRWTAIRAEYTYVNHDSNVRTAGDPATGLEAEKPYEFSHHVVGVKMIMSY